jgi:hypothetical protein
MHQVRGAHHAAAEGFSDRLMSQADAEHRHLSGEVADEFDADSGFVRRARSGRDDDPFGMHRFDVADRDLIVAAYLNLRA